MFRSTSLIRLSGVVLIISVTVGWAARIVTAQLGLGVLQTVALLLAAGMMLVAQWLRHTEPATVSDAGRQAGLPRIEWADGDQWPAPPGDADAPEPAWYDEPHPAWGADEPVDGNEIHGHSSSGTR